MWTASALKSELTGLRARVWRIVEAQHRISTNRLAEGVANQAILERLVEEAKPTLPVAARGLHYLLATPFRYGYPRASRFRRSGQKPGIFYASEHEPTAIAEASYWRLVFFSRSPGVRLPTTVSEHSSFTVPLAADRIVDLTQPPFVKDAASWMAPDDYAACQQLGDAARHAEAQAIRYASVRDPEHRANVAVLDPSVFHAARPTHRQTWHMRIEGGRLTAIAAFPSMTRLSFTPQQFGLPAAD